MYFMEHRGAVLRMVARDSVGWILYCAESSSDTAMYRIRFSNEAKCAVFVALANERKTRGASRTAPSSTTTA